MKWMFYAVLFLFLVLPAFSRGFVDVEGGIAISGYNDVEIPAESGTRFSIQDDAGARYAPNIRVRIGLESGRHMIYFLAAPLSVRGSAKLEKNISYAGAAFSSGDSIDSLYRFDSYRLTYRYALYDHDNIYAGIGLTGKLRSATIALMSGSAYGSRSDLGVVPLINFNVAYGFPNNFGMLFEGDALVTPFGRAEDILLALTYVPMPDVQYRIGYRVLEGGSDGGGNVYTFALFHYLNVGLSVRF